MNVDGHTFRCTNNANQCVVATLNEPGMPLNLTIGFRVVFADIDANGSDDFVLLGENGVWHFSFINVPALGVEPRAPRPGLLTRIRNGFGADTLISYATIQELDRAATDTDPQSFTAPWRSHVPQVVPVVTTIKTLDTELASGGSARPQPYRVYRSVAYEYRNPVYDLWEQSFKGFRRVRADHLHGHLVETRYWFGDCEAGVVHMGCTSSSEASPYKGFAGLPVRVDRYLSVAEDQPGWFSSTTFKYENVTVITPSAPNLPGARADRPVRFPRLAQANEYLYDTSES